MRQCIGFNHRQTSWLLDANGKCRQGTLMNPASLSALALTFPDIDPVAIQIGPLSIHWYALGYITGILAVCLLSKRIVSTPSLWPASGAPIERHDLDDFLNWAVVGIILGGRIGYVLFYNLSYYAANPLQAFAVWDGGMSFHGGALGSILAMVLFARSRGFSPFSLLDVIAAVSCIGIFVVRIANFINSELWGKTTQVPWAFVFPNGGPLPRHPSQLYEAALEGAVLFILLMTLIFVFKKLRTPGFVGGTWVLGYGISRIIVEFFRQPDTQLGYLFGGWLTMGMVLSIPMLLVGLWGMMSSGSRHPWHRRDGEEAQT